MLYGIDISNLQGPPSGYRNQQWYRDAAFVIVQAIEPPQPFNGWDHVDNVTGKRGYTGEQLAAAREDGKQVGVYAWLWNGLTLPYADIRKRLDIVPVGFPLDMRPWVDVEDTTNVSVALRRVAVRSGRAAADDWASDVGLPPSGGYSGDWYINDYLDGWWPDDWLYWQADYSKPPEVLPARPIHQFTSSPIDMDAMLESEIVTQGGQPVTDEERAQMQEKIDGLVSSLGYIGGDVLKPLTRKNAAAYVKTAVGQIRSVCDQQGITHA